MIANNDTIVYQNVNFRIYLLLILKPPRNQRHCPDSEMKVLCIFNILNILSTFILYVVL